jgi:hypothetical protein
VKKKGRRKPEIVIDDVLRSLRELIEVADPDGSVPMGAALLDVVEHAAMNGLDLRDAETRRAVMYGVLWGAGKDQEEVLFRLMLLDQIGRETEEGNR